jgi:hypothetical protein
MDSVDYPNFKKVIKDPVRHDIYYDVWEVLMKRLPEVEDA